MTRPIKTRNKHHKPRLSEAEKLAIRAHKGTKSMRAVATEYNISHRTVGLIWENEKYNSKTRVISRIKKALSDDFLLLVDRSKARVMATIDDATIGQAVVAMGISYDKYRLETDQSTQNVSEQVYLNLINSVPVDDDFDKV